MEEIKYLCLNCGTAINEQFCNAGCKDKFNAKKAADNIENFFYGDSLYSDIYELADYIENNDCEIHELPDDYVLECFKSELSPLVEFDAQWIAERIDDERFPEDNDDKVFSKIINALNECIDFKKLNSMIPELYYETRMKFYITKQDLLNAIS